MPLHLPETVLLEAALQRKLSKTHPIQEANSLEDEGRRGNSVYQILFGFVMQACLKIEYWISSILRGFPSFPQTY